MKDLCIIISISEDLFTQDYYTPLMWAAKKGNISFVKFLCALPEKFHINVNQHGGWVI